MGLTEEADFRVGGRHTAGTRLNPKPRFPARVQSNKEEGGKMKKWQEQDYFPRLAEVEVR